jgi:hypothetical protein
MGIVGPRPETGARIELTRPARGGPPWRYDGNIATLEAQFGLTAVLAEGGEVTVEAASPLPDGVAQKTKLMLRAAWKHAREEGIAPPRRILRWRA